MLNALWEHFTSASDTKLRIQLVHHKRHTECTCKRVSPLAAGIDEEGGLSGHKKGVLTYEAMTPQCCSQV